MEEKKSSRRLKKSVESRGQIMIENMTKGKF